MDDTLQNAIERADLPELVAHFYPDSGAQPGRKGVVFAVWRGDEHESFSLFRAAGGRWLYHDHRTRETGNAFGFLVDICGLSKAEAAAQLKAGGVGETVRPPSGRRRGKARVQAGDAVFDALRRAVTERRVAPFVHPLSQETLSREAARSCVASALETPVGDNQRVLEAAHGALKEIARRKRKAQREGKAVALYDYEDEQGRLLYQVVRFDPKGFSQRRPYGGGWAWGITAGCYVRDESGTLTLDDAAEGDAKRVPLDACRLVLYRLPQVIAAVKAGLAIHVVEGEEDVHALELLGLVATCNAGGAGKWQGAYSNTLREATVIVVPDFDEAGEDHARRVYGELTGVAKRLRIVRLPGLPPAGDVLEVPQTEEEYEALVAFADKLTSTYNCNDEHAPLYDLVAFYIGEWEKVRDADILEGEVPPYRMLAYYLEQRGVSAYRVAKDTGIPQPTLSAVLAQRREVSTDVAKKLAAYFGVSTELFI